MTDSKTKNETLILKSTLGGSGGHASVVGVFRDGQFVVVPTNRPTPARRVLKSIPTTSGLAYVADFAAQRQTKDA